MQVLITLLILLGLPIIVYFLIYIIQWFGKNANLKSKKGILITIIIFFICLVLIYLSKGVFVALLVFLFCPFLIFILVDAEKRIISNNKSGDIENLYNSIPFSLVIISYVLFFVTAAWLLQYASHPRLVLYFIIGAIWGLLAIIKKRNSLKQ